MDMASYRYELANIKLAKAQSKYEKAVINYDKAYNRIATNANLNVALRSALLTLIEEAVDYQTYIDGDVMGTIQEDSAYMAAEAINQHHAVNNYAKAKKSVLILENQIEKLEEQIFKLENAPEAVAKYLEEQGTSKCLLALHFPFEKGITNKPSPIIFFSFLF